MVCSDNVESSVHRLAELVYFLEGFVALMLNRFRCVVQVQVRSTSCVDLFRLDTRRHGMSCRQLFDKPAGIFGAGGHVRQDRISQRMKIFLMTEGESISLEFLRGA